MAPSGYVPLLLLLLIIIITTFASSAQAKTCQKCVIKAEVKSRIFGRDSYSDLTAWDLADIIRQNCSTPGVVYSREHFALLVAITRRDLHRFANYSCDVECAARWIQLGAEIYDRDVNCATTHELNCSHYAQPVKEGDLVHLVQLDQHYSNYSDYDNQPTNQPTTDYGQLVAKWASAMQLVEQYRPREAVFCYIIPTEFAKARREEFSLTIMNTFRQTLEAAWYFEHYTLAPFLNQFCGPKALPHSNQYPFHYFVWSLSSAVPSATNESIHSFVSSICPVYGTQLPLHLSTDLHEIIVPDSYLNTAMILPGIMNRYVSRVKASTYLRVNKNDKGQMVVVTADALEWMKQDFVMMNLLSKGNNNNHNDSIDRVIIRKIVFYLLVPRMTNQIQSIAFGPNFRYIITRLVFVFILLAVGVFIYYTNSKNSSNTNRPQKKYKMKKKLPKVKLIRIRKRCIS